VTVNVIRDNIVIVNSWRSFTETNCSWNQHKLYDWTIYS